MDSVELQEIFSTNLKNARNRANLSQMKLAEKANLSVGYICDLESGRRWGTPETFSKFASALDISPFELLLPLSENSSEAVLELSRQRKMFAKLSDSLKKNISSAVSKAISDTLR
jgi:transcriptional regulator with XRE-family HTH domain